MIVHPYYYVPDVTTPTFHRLATSSLVMVYMQNPAPMTFPISFK